MQYVDETETDFSLRLKNHRRDVYKTDAIPVSRHFAISLTDSKNCIRFFIID